MLQVVHLAHAQASDHAPFKKFFGQVCCAKTECDRARQDQSIHVMPKPTTTMCSARLTGACTGRKLPVLTQATCLSGGGGMRRATRYFLQNRDPAFGTCAIEPDGVMGKTFTTYSETVDE